MRLSLKNGAETIGPPTAVIARTAFAVVGQTLVASLPIGPENESGFR